MVSLVHMKQRSVKTDGTNWTAIGDGVSDRAKVHIGSDNDGSITRDWKWPDTCVKDFTLR